MKEIIKMLNELDITQTEMEFLEGLPEEIYKKYFTNEVERDLDVDKHRWYETSVSVFETEQGYIGVRSVTDLFSEMSDISDICWTLRFFEMEEVQTITYIKKD